MSFPIRVIAGVLVSGAFAAGPATAADLPAVKVSAGNTVPACATPGRLMAFLKARNDKLDGRFDSIATEYMRHGEQLGVRWDMAFHQMIVETGSLKFGGSVKASQNNFAGLGATGGGERGESFKDVATGARAHLEHLVMYTGATVSNPVAERTRKVQEWGVLTDWQKTFKGPLTFAQLARKWAPPARNYAQEIESVAEAFTDGPCKSADPRPELVAAARAGRTDEAATTKSAQIKDASKDAAVSPGVELAKRANDDARAEGTGSRSALGAGAVAKGATAAPADAKAPAAQGPAFALLNPPKPEADATAVAPEKPAGKPAATKVNAPSSAKGAKPAAAAQASSPANCRVFTASYGGAKAMIIKAVNGDLVNYTVLDVNEGSETREADAYIAAYAPGGKPVGEYKSQTMALDKAFELCPEG
jgi:Mannosyl-glycoprotein endo-beta-N-acetylglucosaminidase